MPLDFGLITGHWQLTDYWTLFDIHRKLFEQT